VGLSFSFFFAVQVCCFGSLSPSSGGLSFLPGLTLAGNPFPFCCSACPPPLAPRCSKGCFALTLLLAWFPSPTLRSACVFLYIAWFFPGVGDSVVRAYVPPSNPERRPPRAGRTISIFSPTTSPQGRALAPTTSQFSPSPLRERA